MTLEEAHIESERREDERKNYELYARVFTAESCKIDTTPKDEIFEHFEKLAKIAFRKEQTAANAVNAMLVRAYAEDGTLDIESDDFIDANLYGQLDSVIAELREEGLI